MGEPLPFQFQMGPVYQAPAVRKAFGLLRAYLIYRAMAHRLNLNQPSARASNDRFAQLRRFMVETWQRFLGG